MSGNEKKRSIARQVIVNFCWFAVLMSVVFSLMSFMFLFAVEDEFLERELHAERDRLIAQYEETGDWHEPEPGHMAVYGSIAELPDDMRAQIEEEPRRHEFFGAEGRHYHLTNLSPGTFLLAEVSDRLLIRPMRGVIVTSFLVLALLLTLVGCWIAYKLARRTIAPLTELAAFVDGAEPENLPENFASSYPPNEVGTLAGALEKSLRRSGRLISREKHFNRDVSHDLRTPIAVVSGAVEIMQKRYQLDAPVAELVDRIEVANRHMARTVEALLSLAREEDANILKEPVKILPILEKTIVQFSHFLDGKRVNVEVNVAPQARLQLQPGVLEILLANLLGNAFEFTSQGVVSIGFENNTLSITDTGGGVDEKVRGTMFDIDSKGQASGGFGRGLSIVKRICEHHHIAIHVDHQAGGTRISLRFDQ